MTIFKRRTLNPGGPPEFLVVCLGNPGREYETTRHTTGFIFADLLAEKYDFRINRIQFKAVTGSVNISGKRCLVIKPQTYMNNSGQSVREAASFYKIKPENIIVVFDDVTIPCGRLRIRRKGTDGGHNGIKSIIYQLNADTFPRIKIGIGEKPDPEWNLADWVLSKFTPDDAKLLKSACENGIEALELMVSGDVDGAMNKFNG
ncbi:MAG: aminoacyl-tRNA hydrolase [Clostridia bacterium]|nr:aminoacyl-tRNA hydrolase [Clostridia bacterium]